MKKIVARIWIAFNILIGIITLASAYGGMVSPLRHTFPSILAMTFSGWVVAVILLLVINLFLARKTSLINVATLLACYGAISTLSPLNFSNKGKPGEPEMTVMTYNVQGFLDYTANGKTSEDNPTLKFILDSGADIVALQECTSFDHTPNGRIAKSLVDSIARAYPYRSSGWEGQAVLSRYKLEEITLHYSPSHSFQVRGYKIDSPCGEITLFNLHLKSIGLTDEDKELYRKITDGRAARQPIKEELKEVRHDLLGKLSAAFRVRAEQAQKVKELIDSVGGTVIVCGDFNDIPGCYACREILSEGLKDAYAEAGCGPAITYHASRFFFRIDHIFISRQLRALDTQKLSNPTSDHYPVITRLTKLADYTTN